MRNQNITSNNFGQSNQLLNNQISHQGNFEGSYDNSTMLKKISFLTDVHSWLDVQLQMLSSMESKEQDERLNGIYETVKNLHQAFQQDTNIELSMMPMAPRSKVMPSLDGIMPELRSALTDIALSLDMKKRQSEMVASLKGAGTLSESSGEIDHRIMLAASTSSGVSTDLHNIATKIFGLQLALPGERGKFSLRKYGDFSSLLKILQHSKEMNIKSPDQVAYIIATAWHESRLGTWMTESAWLSEKSAEAYAERSYGSGPKSRNPSRARQMGNTQVGDGGKYMGRGYVQLTWKNNYNRMSKLLKESGFQYTQDGVTYGDGKNKTTAIDLVKNYRHVNQNKDLAARILVLGMDGGHFVNNKKGLDSYIPESKPATKQNFENARKIVNGSDKKALLASNAMIITSVLRQGNAWSKLFTPAKTGTSASNKKTS